MALTQVQDQTFKGLRINKETGELSASGELSVSVEVKAEQVEGSCRSPELPQVLREQMQELGIGTCSSSDHRTGHVPLEQREEHLVKALSLYIKFCEDGGRLEALDAKGLAALTADTVICNIQSRLAGRPAEEAREEVIQFFQKADDNTNSETGESPGWLLLKSLLLLTADSSDILSHINPGLPAALVKCLYLLVCLPAKKENAAQEETFQEPLTQVLLQLCGQPVNVERLVETQELQCLIIGLTSLWEQTSATWRHQASRFLKAVSAVATSNTVPSLLGKNCLRICIQNLLHISADFPGPLLAEVAVAVFSFVRDTYSLSPALFIEFDTNSGYQALENILKRCEEGVSADQFQPVEELLHLIASFTQLGQTELKVALCVTNPQPPGFKFDPPLTSGSAVKNLQAFHLLQASLLRSQDSLLCCQLLRTLQTIWERDLANFFLLEWTVQSMTQLAACVWRKPVPVQKLFFSLLEMVVFKLNYIPHETLHALLGVLKQLWAGTLPGGVTGIEFGVVALNCFHRMTVHSGMLGEVLSDWGLLELLLGELRRRAKILRKAGVVSSPEIKDSVEDSERLLTTCMLQVVSTLTLRSIKNTVSVRDLGMVPYIKIFLDQDQYRGPTLSILEQLAEINPEEFMSTAIGALCSSTQQELRLKWDLLQSVLKVLESPSSWDAFRRAGGFTGLLSLVIDMEGALSDPPQGEVWQAVGHQPLLDLILLALHILALAVHFHTVNAHHFEAGGFYERLAEALLHLGCFHTKDHETGEGDGEEGSCPKTAENKPPGKSFHQFVDLAQTPEAPCSPSTKQPYLPVTLRTCIKLLSYLDQFATGTYSSQELNLGLEPEHECDNKEKVNVPPLHEGEDPQGKSRSTAPSICSVSTDYQYSKFTCDHIIAHPGAIRVIITLLPRVFAPQDPQLSMEVQLSLVHHIQAIVKPERNRQILCEGGLVSTLLAHCQSILLAPAHPLHLPVTRILEKLSSQAITHTDFRKFLCLADPLMCLADKTADAAYSSEADASSGPSVKRVKRTFSLLQSTGSESSFGPAIPVHQIISLVSMTSPRTFRPHQVSSSPAFVEFDMSESGYGCLFLPSLATVKGATADSVSTGGTGGDCRGFPPTAGLSFSCWFQINRFSSACDSHPIRVLSVVRHMSRTEQQYICLSISFSACDGCLVISTEEEAFTYLDMMEPEVSTPTSLPTSLRFSCFSMLVPGQWHHLAVVLAKDVKKSCLTSLYLNGKAVGTGKMRYIQPFPGHYVSMDPTAVIDVYGLIGTPALWKENAALVWRVGPSYLFEEVLSPEAVGVIYVQGTAYLGNFQALHNIGHNPDAESHPLRLVTEERISFGINPAISTLTTVVQIREDYNEVDCRLIAKEMGITSRDHATPVFLARNLSRHLSGTSRTIGAALVGHFGVRTFTPSSASSGLLYVGGPAVVLSLVAMAPDDSSLYAAVKVLLSVLETNSAMQQEMNRINGYKLLAFLLKMKSSLVSYRTFQLVLCLSSSLDLSSGSSFLQNTPAFQALLCDLEVWQNTPDNLDLSVLKHLAEVLKSSSSDSSWSAAVMHRMGLLPKLLFELSDPAVTVQKVKIISCVITSLLKAHFTPLDVSRLGLFLVYTLPPLSNKTEGEEVSDSDLSEDMPALSSGPATLVWIRNQLLLVVCEIFNSESFLIKDQQKALFDCLGSDWFLLFLQPHLHPSTLKLGLVLLTHFLSCPCHQNSFRAGVLPGTLIEGMEEPFAVMDNLQASSWAYECQSTTCPGFDVLQGMLIRHSHLPQVYEAMAALLLGKKASHTAGGKEHLDDILQSLIDSQSETPAQQLCVEAAVILVELVKVIITQSVPPPSHMSSTDASWELQLPASVMQFLCLLHSLRPRDPLWTSPEFLHALAGIVYPFDSSEGIGEACGMSAAEDIFKTHQRKKPVCDFIRILLMDSFLNVSVNTNLHPVVLLLEFSPSGASLEQKQSFQTELLELIIEIIHILGQEEENTTHLNLQDSKNQMPEGQMGTLMENVVFFTKTLLQKLYSGMFLGNSESLLNFLADQIVVALEKGQTQKEKTVSALYSCSNKVLLYFLSQPRRSQEEKERVIRTLQTFMGCWDVFMATYNSNVNFITCLLHCLLLIRSGSYPEGFGSVAQKVQKKKSSSHATEARRSECLSNGASSNTDDKELVSLAEACWSKVMSERQHMLEENYKIEISASHRGDTRPVSMIDISPLWEEMAHKAWLLHTDSQKKKAARSSQKTFDIISSAVRSALSRLGKESITVEEFLSYMESHRQRGHSMFENIKTNHLQLQASEWERVSSKWLHVEAELLRERAVFGPGPGVLLSRDWVQEAAEGPNRTRSRIRRKALRSSKWVLGTLCLGLRTGMCEENKNRREDTEPKILCEVGAEAKEDEEDRGQDCDHLTFFPVLNETPAVSEGPPDPLTPAPCSHTQDCPNIRIILQKLHPGEKVKAKMCVVMVSGLRVTEGVLLFGEENLFLCEGFTLSPPGDVCCRKHHPSSVRDSFISTMLSKDLPSASCRRWLYEDIKEARFMRFLFEDNAIEVFMKNGHSAFLVFLNKDHISANKRLCTVVSALKGRGVADVIASARKTPVVEKTALVKWQKGEISNFEYLMHLNTIAGRTYNDLMQYPVFPWVLADYQSQTLDLSNPATFRDLSKPMGAQTEKRRQMFIQRYEEVENSEGDLAARCHYCTHYSSAIIVASFLVRMEPFSHTFQALQGGFDVAERMFYSIKKEWESASRDNMGDVRELIPEFFYLPDFLVNSNHIQLGCMEDGTTLGDVELPPWAKGDPQEFIRIHREALESDYVSSHLHLWIDLIFGHRQQGPDAVESVNTFHPYFYAQKGRQDAKDPLIRSTILGYISNFGQVPKQLFTKPHPPRCGSKKEGTIPPHPTPFFFKLDKLKTTAQPYRELPRGLVGQIECLEKEVVVLERNRLLLSPLLTCFFSWGFPDNSCAFGNYATEKIFAVCECLCDWGETLCAACPNPTTIITAGTSTVVCVWDVAVNKDKLIHMKLKQPLYGHTDSVTCLAASEVHSIIVSGSRDLTCILWDMEELSYITQLTGHTASVSALAVNELTGEVASCAGPLLYLWTMKGQLLTCTDTSCGPQADILCVKFTQREEWDTRNVIVTGCADGIIRIWKTEYTRTQLPGPPEVPVSPGQDRTERDVTSVCQVKGWKRHLVLCQELNRNQAVPQRRYQNNPPITALAMSRSHATLLTGDTWGRVFTWTCE
ncbi:WD repeat- and FYVE domain-containing protein 4 isoform X1 [Mastacembelus armatus]|uniref:WD repeat- and FYVE domain-containing protein 4 isoform X1 n=1 Tax=Mastacembelus armatus TaxID=205130 RepID=UPI000E45DFB7|nr:WD repeat- and FYVE domain-containing protein 4 isoform X1 [Mastacembelus armatus]